MSRHLNLDVYWKSFQISTIKYKFESNESDVKKCETLLAPDNSCFLSFSLSHPSKHKQTYKHDFIHLRKIDVKKYLQLERHNIW